jgi:hypothetical protein
LPELFASDFAGAKVVLSGTAAAALTDARGMVKIAKERKLTMKTLKNPGEEAGDKRFMNSPYKSCHQPPRGAALLGNGRTAKIDRAALKGIRLNGLLGLVANPKCGSL